MLVIKNTTNNTIYAMQQLLFYKHSMELHLKFHYKAFYQYFHYTLQLTYQNFFSTLAIFII